MHTFASLLQVILIGLASIAIHPAVADDFSKRPVVIVVPFPPGGVDQFAQAMRQDFAGALGADVLVQNKPGGTGAVGTAEVAAALPDGHTLLFSPQGPLAYAPALRSVGYNAASFAPICRVTETPSVLMASDRSGFTSIADVIAAAKAKPSFVSYASAGEGGLPHVAMAALSRMAGVELRHLPRAGAREALDAVIMGEADLLSEQAPIAAARIASGGYRVIAAFSANRLPAFPDVRTSNEQGYDISLSTWNALLAPAGTPDAVVARLSEACQAALASPVVREAMTSKLRTPPAFLDARATTAFIHAEVEKGRKLVEAAGLRR